MQRCWQCLVDLVNFCSVPPRWIFLLVAIVLVVLFLWQPCAYWKESCLWSGDCP